MPTKHNQPDEKHNNWSQFWAEYDDSLTSDGAWDDPGTWDDGGTWGTSVGPGDGGDAA